MINQNPPKDLPDSAKLLEDHLTPEETSEVLGISTTTLCNWRSQGKGPDYVKIGRIVKYPVDGLREFLKGQRRKA